MRYVLDAPALINSPGFSFMAGSIVYLTTEPVFREWKDFRSRLSAEHAVKNGRLLIREPRPSSIDRVRETARRLGTTGLSEADESVLALAFDNNGWEPTVLITDDYRVQNVAKALKIGIESVLMDGIKTVRSYKRPAPAENKPTPPPAAPADEDLDVPEN